MYAGSVCVSVFCTLLVLYFVSVSLYKCITKNFFPNKKRLGKPPSNELK